MMNNKTIFKAIILVTILLFCKSFSLLASSIEDTSKKNDKWILLGITTVKGSLDRDEVKVTSSKGMFTHLKIKVRNASLEMKKMVVYFGNGSTQDVWLKNRFSKGQESREIDLKGDKRLIKKVVFLYKKGNWSNKAPIVALIGQNKSSNNNPAKLVGKWKLLGITTVKRSVDRDEVRVTASKGMFTHLKIKVRNSSLEMKKMIVHFGDGSKQDVWLKNRFSKGQESRAIDLKGNKRIVKKVIFWYKKGSWINKVPIVALIGK
ncbi:DUF2541 family protein [Tenacibaculum ovolyticum]|uniref:DUF2541 family protein n=1 Tax=Tenacibaculum ovolyticum TaxID=104270 RepID=UPI000411C2BD|nr:DUF2541 family protein [Tenacibaculum ovolyticum]